MRFGGSGSVHLLLGRTQSRIRRPTHLRFCPECAQEDLRGAHGEPYWRRLHQITGVLVCPIHATPLFAMTGAPRTSGRGALASLRRALGGAASPVCSRSDQAFDLMCSLARDAQWMLTHDVRHESYQDLWERTRSWFASAGWAGIARHRIQWGRVTDLAMTRVGEQALRSIAGTRLSKSDWHTLFTRINSRYASPTIVRLLVMRLADCSAQSFFCDAAPTATGPIAAKKNEIHADGVCVNPQCLRYDAAGAMYANRVVSARRNFRIVIRCGVCGFTYMRYASVRRNKWNILETGELWDRKLRGLLRNGAPSLRELRRQLGPLSIHWFQYHAARLGVWHNRWSPKSQQRALAGVARTRRIERARDANRARYRREWTKLRREKPTRRVTKLAEEHPRLYSWLYRNDRAWLDEHIPKFVPFQITRRRVVDYEKRDAKWAVLAAQAAERIRSRSGRPVRVTVEAIIDEAPLTGNPRPHLHKLPATSKVLQQVVETDQQFFERRLRSACQFYLDRRVVPGKCALEARIGLAGATKRSRDVAVRAAVRAIRRHFETGAALPRELSMPEPTPSEG